MTPHSEEEKKKNKVRWRSILDRINLPDTVGFLLCVKPALHATNLRENIHYLCHTLSFLSQVARHEDSPVASLNARLVALLMFLPLAASLRRHTLDINY